MKILSFMVSSRYSPFYSCFLDKYEVLSCFVLSSVSSRKMVFLNGGSDRSTVKQKRVKDFQTLFDVIVLFHCTLFNIATLTNYFAA